MKTRILALTGALLLLGAFPAVAGTNKLTGKFQRSVGASTSKITIKVKTNKKGVATKVTSFSVKAQSECKNDAENSLKPGPVVSAKLGSFKIKKSGIGKQTLYRIEGDRKINGVKHNVSASFSSKKGRKVSGSIGAVGRIADKACVIPSREFSAKRK